MNTTTSISDNLFYSFNTKLAEETLLKNKSILNKFITLMKLDLYDKDYESLAKYAKKMAYNASEKHAGIYASKAVEEMLLLCAENLPTVNIPENIFPNSSKRKVLHILSEGYSIGGHTKIVDKWIKKDTESVHSLITTWQINSTPSLILDNVVKSGGKYLSLSSFSNLETEKAMILRKIAYSWADIIVLHIHMYDPIPIMAFGIDGGPPIVYMNHGDHVFWLGSSISDIVLDMRKSGQKISYERRGINSSYLFPIPLEEKEKFDKLSIRKKYNISKDDFVILTIAPEYKCVSYNQNKFANILKDIAMDLENIIIYVIGPKNHGEWEKISNLSDGKIKVMGVKSNVNEFYQISDIYINSFMMGGMTCVLDAVLYDLPIIKYKAPNLPTISGYDECLNKFNFSSVQEIKDVIKKYQYTENYNKEILLKTKNTILSNHVLNTKMYINDIYSKVSTHSINRNLSINNFITDEDLFWAIIRQH